MARSRNDRRAERMQSFKDLANTDWREKRDAHLKRQAEQDEADLRAIIARCEEAEARVKKLETECKACWTTKKVALLIVITAAFSSAAGVLVKMMVG